MSLWVQLKDHTRVPSVEKPTIFTHTKKGKRCSLKCEARAHCFSLILLELCIMNLFNKDKQYTNNTMFTLYWCMQENMWQKMTTKV